MKNLMTSLLLAAAYSLTATNAQATCTLPTIETTVIPPELASTYILGGGSPQATLGSTGDNSGAGAGDGSGSGSGSGSGVATDGGSAAYGGATPSASVEAYTGGVGRATAATGSIVVALAVSQICQFW